MTGFDLKEYLDKLSSRDLQKPINVVLTDEDENFVNQEVEGTIVEIVVGNYNLEIQGQIFQRV